MAEDGDVTYVCDTCQRTQDVGPGFGPKEFVAPSQKPCAFWDAGPRGGKQKPCEGTMKKRR